QTVKQQSGRVASGNRPAPQRRPAPPATLLSEVRDADCSSVVKATSGIDRRARATITVWNENGPGKSRARTLDSLVIERARRPSPKTNCIGTGVPWLLSM